MNFRIKKLIYKRGIRPKPGSIFYSPSLAFTSVDVVGAFVKGMERGKYKVEVMTSALSKLPSEGQSSYNELAAYTQSILEKYFDIKPEHAPDPCECKSEDPEDECYCDPWSLHKHKAYTIVSSILFLIEEDRMKKDEDDQALQRNESS